VCGLEISVSFARMLSRGNKRCFDVFHQAVFGFDDHLFFLYIMHVKKTQYIYIIHVFPGVHWCVRLCAASVIVLMP